MSCCFRTLPTGGGCGLWLLYLCGIFICQHHFMKIDLMSLLNIFHEEFYSNVVSYNYYRLCFVICSYSILLFDIYVIFVLLLLLLMSLVHAWNIPQMTSIGKVYMYIEHIVKITDNLTRLWLYVIILYGG